MKVITAPNEYLEIVNANSPPAVFLAGGITNCPNWQEEMIAMLSDTSLVLLNPRREQFPIDDPGAAEGQIKWEFRHLRMADAILFWFPKETLCPIVLYELGAWSMTDKPLCIGCDSAYMRMPDVVLQTRLARPEIRIVNSLSALAIQVRDWSDQP